MADYESVLCVKSEVFVYRIPARTSNRGYRAAEWKLDEPDWTGRLKVVAKGHDLTVRLEDKNSGELFAQCPVESYPSSAVEQVLDSSRYFVIRIQDVSGRAAFIGLGFADRGDSFDLLVSLQDHFKQIRREETAKEQEKSGTAMLDSGPKLDLSFKEGQTITINMPTKKSGESTPGGVSAAKQRPRAGATGTSAFLPPPPGAGTRVAAIPKPSPAAATAFNTMPVVPPSSIGSNFTSSTQQQHCTVPSAISPPQGSYDLLVDFGSSPGQGLPPSSLGVTGSMSQTSDLFTSDWDSLTRPTVQPAGTEGTKASQPVPDHNWVNFD
jgi:hypothetical protein